MDVVVFVVYVDDLLMFGGPQLELVLSKVRREIKMDDPEEIGKYLGCNHEFVTVGPTTTIDRRIQSRHWPHVDYPGQHPIRCRRVERRLPPSTLKARPMG